MTECFHKHCHNKATAMAHLNDDTWRPICEECLQQMIWVIFSWRRIKEEEE